ncbi:unnamed protein product [Auanema sp. JU1783]|nr:unnamed protein product [Auanema sp. JU1783]
MTSEERFVTSLTVQVDDYRSKHEVIYEAEDIVGSSSKNGNFDRSNRSQSLRLPVNNSKNKGIFHSTSFVRRCLRKDSEAKLQCRPLHSADWIVYESRILPEPQVHQIVCSEAKIELTPDQQELTVDISV